MSDTPNTEPSEARQPALDEGYSRRFLTDKGPIAWMAKNHVASNIVMVIILVGGLMMALQLKKEVFPEFDMDYVAIHIAYPGASPEEVEQGMLLAIEEELRGLDGIKQVTGVASENFASVYTELEASASPERLVADIKNAVDRIPSFPEDAERPVVSLMTNKREVISLAIHGETDEASLRALGEQMRDMLLQRPEITQVELGGTRPVEVSVEIPLETLRRYGLTLDQVARKIRQTAVQVPAGVVKTASGELLLRTDERREMGTEFMEVPIIESPDGTVLKLADIAQVRDGFSEVDEYALFDGQPAVLVKAYRVGAQTPVSVAGAAKDVVEAFAPSLPGGLQVSTVADWSELYRGRMDLLINNALFGLLLVMVVLGLFLQPGLAFWVTLGIPISFLGSVCLLPPFGVSINMISMFAFIVTLGIVVDDAIVVGERVFACRQQGMTRLEAAIAGAREVSMPVTFSILTTVVAFMPMLFVPGFSGKLFGVIPAVVISVLLLSLFESLFILPAHLSAKASKRPNPIITAALVPLEAVSSTVGRWLEGFITGPYQRSLKAMLRKRYLVVAVGVACLLATVGYVAGGHIAFSFMPRVESDRVTSRALLPYGSPVAQTEVVQARLISAAQEALDELGDGQEVGRGIYSQLGRGIRGGGPSGRTGLQPGAHLTMVQVRLVASDKRDFSALEFTELWREKVGNLPNVESLGFKSQLGASPGSPVDIQLSHRDQDMLEQAATRLATSLETYAGVSDIDTGFSSGKPQLNFELTPEARSLGLTTMDLARQVRGAFFGAEALRQQRGRDEMRVYVRLPLEQRRFEGDVEALMIRTPQGGEIPLGRAATVSRTRADNEIKRVDGRRTINVTADVDKKVTNGSTVVSSLTAEVLPILQADYPGLGWRLEGEQRAQSESLQSLGLGYLMAMLVILALLAIPFKSYFFQPMVVMAAIPFGLVGAVVGHIVMGFELSIISMMGIVALSGVVVNDSLVLIVATNRLRERGLGPYESIVTASVTRFRPILLTSLTTFFGLLPMIFETSVQARFLVPMAISLGYGVLFVTVIVLVLVPAFYMVVEDIKRLFGASGADDERDSASVDTPRVANL